LNIQVVQNGTVINLIVVPDSAVVSGDGSSVSWSGVTGITDDTIPAPDGTTFVAQSGAQIGWHMSGGVLVAPTAAALSKAELIAYANNKLQAYREASRSYDLGSGTSVLATADVDTIALVNGLGAWGTENPASTQNWTDDSGNVTQITGTQAVTLYSSGLSYLQSLYAVLAAACIGINSGAITTTAQIDGEEWPA